MMVNPETQVIVDRITKDQPLQELIDQMKALLKQYQSSFDVRVSEQNGTLQSIELIVRIQAGGNYANRR